LRAAAILKPYERRREPGVAKRAMLFGGLILVAAMYGLLCSILPFRFVVIPAVPIMVLVGLILWMLPDVGGMPYARLRTLMLWYLGVNILWPNYVAVNLPGLPWITPTRIIVFSMVVIFVYALSTSGAFRRSIIDSLDTEPWLRKLFWLFWATTTVSIVFSIYPFASFNRYVNNQVYWTMFLALSAFLATRPNFVLPAGRILAWSMIVVSLLGIYEYAIQRVFWLDHLPDFLKADLELLAIAGETQARAGTGLYRVRGTFVASLYFAEYTAMAFPFVLHFLFRAKSIAAFALLFAGVMACATTMYLTNARSAMIGLLLALVLYGFFAAWRIRRQQPNSLASTAVVFGYPAVMLFLMLAVLSWNRLRVAVIGGGQNVASDNARSVQWDLGFPMALSHPLGHGVARSGGTLGYTNRAGEATIDSYYLSLLLEYGFLGLASFMLLFLLAAWLGFRAYNASRTEEEQMVGPLTMALVNFTVIKSVLSSEANMPVAFVMLGALLGLVWQMRQSGALAPGRGRIAVPRAAAGVSTRLPAGVSTGVSTEGSGRPPPGLPAPA
jgi:O-antigen ligase